MRAAPERPAPSESTRRRSPTERLPWPERPAKVSAPRSSLRPMPRRAAAASVAAGNSTARRRAPRPAVRSAHGFAPARRRAASGRGEAASSVSGYAMRNGFRPRRCRFRSCNSRQPIYPDRRATHCTAPLRAAAPTPATLAAPDAAPRCRAWRPSRNSPLGGYQLRNIHNSVGLSIFNRLDAEADDTRKYAPSIASGTPGAPRRDRQGYERGGDSRLSPPAKFTEKGHSPTSSPR